MDDPPSLSPETGRKAPAGGAHIHLGGPNIFFVTINAKDRVPWMAQEEVHHSLVRIWREQATAWLVGYHLVMPDHVHLFCAPRNMRFGIDQWITFWKRQFSRAHIDKKWEFQRRAFHHRIRDRDEYVKKYAYVRENPLRKGLVENVDDWPLQGVVHPEVRWG